jgi:hypothetical protein
VSTFRLIEAEKATHSVPKLCKLLGVSRSGYSTLGGAERSRRGLASMLLFSPRR